MPELANNRIAVIDVETTGLLPKTDRVVEIAVVVLKANGTKAHEFTTLVNPKRDVGPTRIHGITSADVVRAPTFDGVLGHIAEAIDGCVAIAGHNVRFDRTFVAREFERCSAEFPECWEIDTMRVAGGGSLAACCEEFGVRFDGFDHLRFPPLCDR